MGLFKQKQSADAPNQAIVIDDELREELRAFGRDYFQRVLKENSDHLKQDLDMTVAHVGDELKSYMTKQLDMTMAHVNEQMSKQLSRRIADYDRVTHDAHDLAVQSLNRSAHALHEQYEQFSSALQQNIAAQEATMAAAYNDNKKQLSEIKDAQDKALQSLEISVNLTDKQRKRLGDSYQKAVSDQEKLLSDNLEETQLRLQEIRDYQDKALKSIDQSVQALENQYQQLSSKLDERLARQEELLVNSFHDNMASVVEHYLLEAMGDQYDMKAQLPMIIKQMEANKQAIADDMKL